MSLHKYRVLEDQQLADMATTVRPAVGGAQGKPQVKPLQRLANTLMGAFEETNEERFAEMDEAIIRQRQIDRKGIWMGPNLAGHPNGMAVGDLDGDGQQEVAIALEHSIIIARIVAGEFNLLKAIKGVFRLPEIMVKVWLKNSTQLITVGMSTQTPEYKIGRREIDAPRRWAAVFRF